jgi:hypothetical protein
MAPIASALNSLVNSHQTKKELKVMPIAKTPAKNKTKPQHRASISAERIESLTSQYRSLATYETMDRFLSQLTLDELKALMAATGTGDHSLVPPRNGLAPSRSARAGAGNRHEPNPLDTMIQGRYSDRNTNP